MQLESEASVVITSSDCAECAKFFEFFNIPMPEELSKALRDFSSNPCIELQNEVKYQLAHAICTTDHPVFRDEAFVRIKEETSKEYDILTFDREFEKALMTTDET